MTLDGADGETRREMARVLHLDPKVKSDSSFAALQASLGEIGPKTARIAGESKQNGGPSEPITIAVANRLFAQAGYEFRPQFFAEVKENFGAAPEIVDFAQRRERGDKKNQRLGGATNARSDPRFDPTTARSRHAPGPRKRALSQGALGQRVFR